MTLQERLEIVKKNYKNVKLRHKYPTQSKIYEALGLPKESSSNKQNKKVVEKVFTIKSTGSFSKPREVMVTGRARKETIRNLTIEDGRVVNGGAHNTVYEPILRNALAYGLKADPGIKRTATYISIFRDCYGFDKDLLAYEDKTDNQIKYLIELKRKLCKSTNAALKNLVPEVIKEYERVYEISSYDFPRIPAVPDDTKTLEGFIKEGNAFYPFGMTKSSSPLATYIDGAFPKGKGSSKMPLGEFVFSTEKYIRDDVISCLREEYWSECFDDDPQSRVATKEQTAVIKEIDEYVAKKKSLDPKKINSPFVSRVAAPYREVLYNLLGWEFVWQSIQYEYRIKRIPKKKYAKKKPEETFDLLKPELELAMRDQVFNCTKVDASIRTLSASMDAKMAFSNKLFLDKDVSRLHCEIFKLKIDENYFMQLLPEVKAALKKKKKIEDIRKNLEAEVAAIASAVKPAAMKPVAEPEEEDFGELDW